jgi:hypothetical protein
MASSSAVEQAVRRAALLGVLQYLFACVLPIVPADMVGYPHGLVGAHKNGVVIAAMQVSGSRRITTIC